jgi:hypothetical protein
VKEKVFWGDDLEFEHAGTEIHYNEINLSSVSGKSKEEGEKESKNYFLYHPRKKRLNFKTRI